jgi:hypothetical protein
LSLKSIGRGRNGNFIMKQRHLLFLFEKAATCRDFRL